MKRWYWKMCPGNGPEQRKLNRSTIRWKRSISVCGIVWISVFLMTAFSLEASEIHEAALYGDLARIKSLVKADPKMLNLLDGREATPLHVASEEGFLEVAHFLLAEGAKLNAQDTDGNTALHRASFYGLIQIVDLLLESGADPAIKNSKGRTAPFLAAQRGRAEVMKRLLSVGLDARQTDSTATSPLHLAAAQGSPETIAALLEYGADVNSRNLYGDTPLHGAAWGGHAEAIELLLLQNAEVNVRNHADKSPRDYALMAGHAVIAQKLEEHGAMELIVPEHPERGPITLTILYDHTGEIDGAKPDWGFACLIEGTEKTILFDSGTSPKVFAYNLSRLNIDPNDIDRVVLSHDHSDHVGGLSTFMAANDRALVYLLPSFHFDLIRHLETEKLNLQLVTQPRTISRNVYTTGKMGERFPEQALILRTAKGLVVITGCAHPGIVEILRKTKELFEEDIYMVLGGFHLYSSSEEQVEEVVKAFAELGVAKVGATHCTGSHAINAFREHYEDDYVEMGAGRVIEIY